MPRQNVSTGHAAVAIGEAGVRRNDERRIHCDQIEGLAEHRFEKIAFAKLDARDPVHRGVEPREPDGARAQVRGDDLTGPARHRDGLSAAPRAEVERTGGGTLDGGVPEGP